MGDRVLPSIKLARFRIGLALPTPFFSLTVSSWLMPQRVLSWRCREQATFSLGVVSHPNSDFVSLSRICPQRSKPPTTYRRGFEDHLNGRRRRFDGRFIHVATNTLDVRAQWPILTPVLITATQNNLFSRRCPRYHLCPYSAMYSLRLGVTSDRSS